MNVNHEGDPEVNRLMGQMMAGLRKQDEADARKHADDVALKNRAADIKAALQEAVQALDGVAATLQQMETIFKMIGGEAEGSRDAVAIANLAEIGQKLYSQQRDAVDDARGFASTALSG